MEALEKAATPAPWVLRAMGGMITDDTGKHVCHILQSSDAQFICEARDFVPWAIKRIRALEKVKDAAKDVVLAHCKEDRDLFIMVLWDRLADAQKELEKNE